MMRMEESVGEQPDYAPLLVERCVCKNVGKKKSRKGK